MMPDTVHQTPAPIEKVAALGLSPVPGSRVATPIPSPSMLRRSWVTRATTTPASTAPQETLLSMIVRASSAGVTGLICGASWSPRRRGILGSTVSGIILSASAVPLSYDVAQTLVASVLGHQSQLRDRATVPPKCIYVWSTARAAG